MHRPAAPAAGRWCATTWLAQRPDQAWSASLNLQALICPAGGLPSSRPIDLLRHQLLATVPYGHDPLGVEPGLPPWGDPVCWKAADQPAARERAVIAGQPPTQLRALPSPAEMAGSTHCSGDGTRACRAQRRLPGL